MGTKQGYKLSRIEFFPIKIFLAFLVFTEILFWIGPNQYQIENGFVLFVYLVLVNFALYIGYWTGIKNHTKSNGFEFKSTTITILLLLGLLAMWRSLTNAWLNHGLSVSFETLINGILNPGETYMSESDEAYHGSFFDMTFLALFRVVAIPLGISKWKRLNGFQRVLVIMIIFVQVAWFLGVGIRKGLLDLLLYFFIFFIVKKPNYVTDAGKRRKMNLTIIIGVIVFLFYFVFSIASRRGNTLSDVANLSGSSPREFYSEHLPGWLVYSLQSITGYLCQGYYALARGLEIGIKKIAMFGDSWVSIYYSKKFFGFDPTPYTYMYDLQAVGIDMRVNWHTMYLWLANQYTFIGVPFVIFVIGYFFAQTWKDSLGGHNDLSYINLAFFVIMVFYMFANNQVFSDYAVAFWFWFILYQLSRKTKLNRLA